MFSRSPLFGRLCTALILTILTVVPLEAATDLTHYLLSSRSSMVVHIKDFKKLHQQMPLPLRSIEKLMPTLSLLSDIVPSATLRMGLPRNFGKIEDPQKQEQPIIIAQLPMTIDFDMAAALELSGEALTPFALNIPQGVNLRLVGQLDDLFLAKTELAGQVHLLMASAPELLLAMAQNRNQNKESRQLNDGVLWGAMVVDPRDLPDDQAQSFSTPLRIEYDMMPSEKELIVKIHVNTKEIASHFLANDPNLVQKARHLPMVSGNGPLHLLLSWNNSFIRPDLTLQDLLKQYSVLLTPEMMNNVEDFVSAAQSFMGVQWSDILDVLRGTITLGVIDSVDSPWGALPGLYLHLGGAGEKLKTGLLESVKLLSDAEPQMKGIRSVEGSTWKGYSTPDGVPVQASLLSVPHGLIITTLPPEQLFSGTPQPSTAMAAMTTTPAISSFGIDVASLYPLVQPLWKEHGTAFLQSMASQKNPVTLDDAQRFLNSLFQWSDMIITASDDENGEIRLVVNTEPPVVTLENPQSSEPTPVCACNEAACGKPFRTGAKQKELQK